eukprot:jgi/Tetstr1/463499/TSEL_000748.t1
MYVSLCAETAYWVGTQAFELLDRLSPVVMTEGLPDSREGSARGAPEPLASLAQEVAGALASLSPDAEAMVCRTANGWLLPGPRGATLLQPVDEAALVWHCHQGGGGGHSAWQHKRAGGIIKHNTNAVKNMAATQAVPGDSNVDEGSSPEPPAK